MLKKLLKHEFRATARTYGGLYLALLAVSVLFGASIRGWNGTNSDAYSTAVGLLSLAYTAVLIGTAVVTVMTIVRRFYSNLLGREGYLMHTLPVTEAQLVGAKLISGTVWSVCSIFAAGLSFGILAILMMAEIDLLDQLPWMLSQLREAFARYDMAFWEMMLFSGLVCFVRMVSAIACIYAACMVGHQFKSHPALAGILSFSGCSTFRAGSKSCCVWVPESMRRPSIPSWVMPEASRPPSLRRASWAARPSRWASRQRSGCSGSG